MPHHAFVHAAVLMVAGLGAAQADPVSGTFNDRGYDVFTINLASTSVVDFLATGGYGDPTISLFDGAGSHLISNDDSAGLNYHLTQTLGSGPYAVLVSYCCASVNFASDAGATFSNSDGVNAGSYWIGGSATLASMQDALDAAGFNLDGMPYDLNLTISAVPEPATFMLYGLGLAGLALARRRRT